MARELVAGAKAPVFTLARDGGTSVSLKDFKGRNLVLYFYPKADTPGCTKEAIAFSRHRAVFAKAGTEILGVSADPVAAQDKFKAKHKLKIALGSDESKKMLEAYGAWGEKSMYGRKFMGVIRKTFLIDGSGRIVVLWRDPRETCCSMTRWPAPTPCPGPECRCRRRSKMSPDGVTRALLPPTDTPRTTDRAKQSPDDPSAVT